MDDEAIRDLFAGLGGLTIRRMFGGKGIYSNGLIFAIEADGEMYLKTDQALAKRLEAQGSRPFMYEKNGKPYVMSYWLLPVEALDEPDIATEWARQALSIKR